MRDVAEGHLPLGDVPDFLNEKVDMKKFEDDLAVKWLEETEKEEKYEIVFCCFCFFVFFYY